MSDSNKDKFFKNYNEGIPQIIKKEFIADIETPISSFIIFIIIYRKRFNTR
mgnify:CR=1 FL=1